MANAILSRYKLLAPYFKKYGKQYIAGMACLLLIIGGQLLIPQFIRRAIDALVMTEQIFPQVLRAMVLMICVTVGLMCARYGWRHFLAITGRKIEQELRYKTYKHVQRLSKDYYKHKTSGDIIAHLTNDLQAIRMACSFGLVSLTDGIVMGGAIIAVLFINYPQLSIIILSPLFIIALLVFFGSALITSRYKKVQEGYAVMTQETRQTLLGIQEIKSLGREKFFAERFTKTITAYRNANLSYAQIWSILLPAILFFSGLANLLLLFFGGGMIARGELGIGDFVAALTYLEMLIWPMIGAGFTVNIIAEGAASLTRIGSLLATKPTITERDHARSSIDNYNIKIQGLDFSFADTSEALFTNIHCAIPYGEHIGITGRTGAGKSTIGRLLPRLIDPPHGTIFLGRHDIRSYSLNALRQAICYLPQEPFLFSDTISNNIKYAKPSVNIEWYHTILHACSLTSNDIEFVDGLETEIGERGVMLSGGQKQRIALARALLVNPPILILDDTLSALDSETSYKVSSTLHTLRTGKTTIIISNKVQAILKCNQIFVIEGGKIAQKGNPHALSQKEGLFRQLWQLQLPHTSHVETDTYHHERKNK